MTSPTSEIQISGAGTPGSFKVSEDFARRLKGLLKNGGSTPTEETIGRTTSAWKEFESRSVPNTSFSASPELRPYSQSYPSSPVLSPQYSFQPLNPSVAKAERLKNGFVFAFSDEQSREQFIQIANSKIRGLGQAMKDVRSHSDSQLRAMIYCDDNRDVIFKQLNQTFGSGLDWK